MGDLVQIPGVGKICWRKRWLPPVFLEGYSGAQLVKSCHTMRDAWFDPWVGRSGEGKVYPPQYILLWETTDSFSLWGHQKSGPWLCISLTHSLTVYSHTPSLQWWIALWLHGCWIPWLNFMFTNSSLAKQNSLLVFFYYCRNLPSCLLESNISGIHLKEKPALQTVFVKAI